MINQFYFKQFNLACHLFALSLNFKEFYLTHRLDPIKCYNSGVGDKIGPRSDGNEGVLRIPHGSSITGGSPSDCLMSYPERSVLRGLPPRQRCSWCILYPQPSDLV